MSHRAFCRTAIGLAALAVAGCQQSGTEPRSVMSTPFDATSSAVKFWDVNASADWNEEATSLASRRATNSARLYAYLSLAQLRAAEGAAAITPHPPTSAAIGSASAAVLSAYFPLDVAEIQAMLAAQASREPTPNAKHEEWAIGQAIGQAAAAWVLAWSAGDLIGAADPGTPPVGPGYWIWNGGPIARGGYGARPFFLSSGNEFLPPPPPAFGSAAFVAALAEVRQLSDTRTAAQLASAQYWNLNQSPSMNRPLNDMAVSLIRRHRRSDAEAARILFLMNAAAFDAVAGCFNAKYTYWFIRPPQADPLITLPIGLPPHPSYPSAHSCVSGSSAHVLAAAFPSERDELEQLATEASLSRLYAGIHFRFDMDAGLALGRAVAEKALAADLRALTVP